MYLPRCLSVLPSGHLAIGGLDIPQLAQTYGTPLYLMDEDDIRNNCRSFLNAIKENYPGDGAIAFASKAFLCKAMTRLLAEEGMSLDVVSAGELYTAMSTNFPTERIYFHGNNKTDAEIKMGLDHGVRFVVDNREELLTLQAMAQERNLTPQVSFRIKPGVDAHTHDFILTGKIDSKFGFALETGEAFAILQEAQSLSHIHPIGLHCHIGSQIFDAEPFDHTVNIMVDFMAELRDKLGLVIQDLNLGGGFGIRYIESHDPRPPAVVVQAACEAVIRETKKHGLPLPRLVLEPGRSVVGETGVTVYRVGSVKQIPNICTYVSVDGGMTDNPRCALYDAVYDALVPTRPTAEKTQIVTIAGRCCESGDLVTRDCALPPVSAGDLLCVLSTGAYNYSMASHYNRVPNAPVVFVRGGQHRLVVRRETYEDMTRNDVE